MSAQAQGELIGPGLCVLCLFTYTLGAHTCASVSEQVHTWGWALISAHVYPWESVWHGYRYFHGVGPGCLYARPLGGS